ncbi:MAG TPA: acetolactate synthase [Candidatus Limnocylindria bacterium]|jgi:hypothetical protein|nr:acetolactate synthase [Candidatus Limnocylindria bacterium]
MGSVTQKAPPSEAVVQFSVFTPNRLGRLHELASRMVDRDVHILALTVLDTTDSTILRFIVDDPDRARELLGEHGFAFTETTVVVIEMQCERQLRDIFAALLEAELNVHYTYPFLTRPNGKSALAVSIEHKEVAEDALRRKYFTVLYQNDISR